MPAGRRHPHRTWKTWSEFPAAPHLRDAARIGGCRPGAPGAGSSRGGRRGSHRKLDELGAVLRACSSRGRHSLVHGGVGQARSGAGPTAGIAAQTNSAATASSARHRSAEPPAVHVRGAGGGARWRCIASAARHSRERRRPRPAARAHLQQSGAAGRVGVAGGARGDC